jgi:hypothetical protein
MPHSARQLGDTIMPASVEKLREKWRAWNSDERNERNFLKIQIDLGEKSIFLEVIIPVIRRKKVQMNMCLILNSY